MLRATNAHAGSLLSWGDIGQAFGDVIHVIGDIGHAIGDAISSTAGDILQWAKDEVKAVGRIIQDTVTGALHFVMQIGEKIYHAALDTAHAVVGAVQWVFDKIKTGINKLISFVEMLFRWDDIRRTKDVMHNAFKLWMQHEVDYIPKSRDALNKNFEEFKGKMNEWSGNNDWSSLGDAFRKMAADSASNPNKDQTSGSKFLANHYQNHANQLKIVGESLTVSAVEQLVNDLVTAVSKEGAVLEGAYKQLKGPYGCS